jgi:hypothetical protein
MIFKGVFNLRLVSSESIISSLYMERIGDEDTLWIDNPMEVTFYPKPNSGSMISLSPWLPFAEKNSRHQIYSDSILAMTKCTQEMVDYYNSVVIKYTNGPVGHEVEEESEEGFENIEDVENSLDVLEAMMIKSKGKLH